MELHLKIAHQILLIANVLGQIGYDRGASLKQSLVHVTKNEKETNRLRDGQVSKDGI